MSLNKVIGQRGIKQQIQAELKYVRSNPYATFRHTLLTGGAGLGKTTLASAIASELKYEFVAHTAGSDWDRRKIEYELLNLKICGYDEGGLNRHGKGVRYVFMIDEVHSIPRKNFEYFYEPLQNAQINLMDGGYSWLPDITFIFATTETSKLPQPFVDRCHLQLRLEPYTAADLAKIVSLNYPNMSESDAMEAAKRAKGVARIALSYAESIRRHGLVYFDNAEIDDMGLTSLDRKYLQILEESDRPLSLTLISSMLSENRDTITNSVEPYLMAKGLIRVTSRGREFVARPRGPRKR